MRFDTWWIHLILQCVKSVSYNVTHGFREMGHRGIRQGDPLSPYLFILCAEGLSALICKYEREKWLHRVKIFRNAPVITHMLFANDCYICCKAKEEESCKLLELLNVYKISAGQKVNSQNSLVFSVQISLVIIG